MTNRYMATANGLLIKSNGVGFDFFYLLFFTIIKSMKNYSDGSLFTLVVVEQLQLEVW